MEKETSNGESSRPPPKLIMAGDRKLFVVELRQGETTTVSWKKLMKEADKINSKSAVVPDPTCNARPNFGPTIAPSDLGEKEMKDEPPANRFSSIVEKIERLYMGKDSSDEEELENTPDDDEYDTDDSFIDDLELDEYFEVDNTAIKHDGFFVNRGKLEKINEPPIVPNQKHKKRQRKDLVKPHGDIDDGRVSKVKVAKMTAGEMALTRGDNSSNPSKSLRVSNGDALIMAGVKATGKLKAEVTRSVTVVSNKLTKANTSSAVLNKKNKDSRPGKLLTKKTKGMRESPDGNLSGAKYPMQATKTSQMRKKDSSSVKSKKSSMLESAIRELENMVAESRPRAAMVNLDAESSSQAVKRRLPRELKLRLANVATIAASQGGLTDELINRLMGIVGHLIQLRTLKRNLNEMISIGLSAKQEKDEKLQQIKKDVCEMIKMRIPSTDNKAFELEAETWNAFQNAGSQEKVALKRKFNMDMEMEDKICDYYDSCVDGLDKDSGPHIRKLYAELAELWPSGLMDNREIKNAICRAKERQRNVYVVKEV